MRSTIQDSYFEAGANASIRSTRRAVRWARSSSTGEFSSSSSFLISISISFSFSPARSGPRESPAIAGVIEKCATPSRGKPC